VCLRKVFPHEVRNIIAFKKHSSVGPDGKAKYPLPAEGQAENLPRLLGGSVKDLDSEDHPSKPTPTPTRHWDEGWYLWTGKGRWAALEKTEKMMLDFQQQQQLEQARQSRKEIWHDYQEQLKQSVGDHPGAKPKHPPAWWGPLVPPKSISPDPRFVFFYSTPSYITNGESFKVLFHYWCHYPPTSLEYGTKLANLWRLLITSWESFKKV